MSPRPQRHDGVTIHLNILGQEHEFPAQVRVGATRPVEVLPLAHRVTDAITEVAVREGGAEVTCRVGCAACCRHLVPVAPLEALQIAKLVKAMPGNRREGVRKRFQAAVRRLEELGLIDRHALPGRTQLTSDATHERSAWENASLRYFDAGIACPLLERERCLVYEDRPVACRQHVVTTPPERCKSLEGGAEGPPHAVWMSEILADLSASIGDVDAQGLPLPLSLEWSEACGAELEGEVDGAEVARDLMGRVTAALEPTPVG